MPLAAGTHLGRYEIVGSIGAGGMGEVYRARDPRLGRDVAVKVLPDAVARDPDRLARFDREARAVAALAHPNILSIFDVGETDGQTYAVMELLEGETLRVGLAAGPVPVRRAVAVATQLARGLAAAHDRGLVHRDLKPENVFVLPGDHVKILDFGLARSTTPDGAETKTVEMMTAPGVTLGTVGYMAPEQIRGQPVDARADIFALGCVIYELLSGHRAFARDTAPETLTAILNDDPVDVPEIPAALSRIVHRCLEKTPARRFQSAHDLAFALEQTQPAPSGTAPQPGIAARTPVRGGRLVLVIAAGALVSTVLRPSARPPLQSAFSGLTVETGEESWPSLSPDGTSFVYVSRAAGNLDIYLRRLDGRNVTNLTADSSAADTMPAYSPDGRFIAFRSDREGGGLFLMQATGENVRRLADNGYNPAWSPDGKTIAFSTRPSNPFSIVGKPELWIVSVADGALKKLTDAPAMQPSWAPDGRRITTYGYRTTGQRFLQVSDAEGGDPVPLFEPTSHAVYWNPIWTPGWLYFISTEAGPAMLARVPVDARGRTTGLREQVVTPASWIGQVSAAADGHAIVYQAVTERYSLRRAPFDLKTGFGEPIEILSGALGISDIDVSPDGQTVVFSSKGSTRAEDIFTVDRDGGHLRQVTDDAFEDRGPSWTDDGRRILFYSSRGGGYGLWSINPDGSGLQPLVSSSAQGGQDWFYPRTAPGNRLMAFGPNGLTFFDTTVSPPRLLASVPKLNEAFFAGPWSSDGTLLAGSEAADLGRPPQDREVVVYHADTQRYDRFPKSGVALAWLPGNTALLVRSNGLEALDLTTRSRTPVGPWPAQAGQTRFSRDMRTTFYASVTTDADIWLATLQKR